MLRLVTTLRHQIKVSNNRSNEIRLLSEKLLDLTCDLKYPNNYNDEVILNKLSECIKIFEGQDHYVPCHETKDIDNYMKAGLFINFLYENVADLHYRHSTIEHSKMIMNEKIYEKIMRDCEIFPMKMYQSYFDKFSVKRISDDDIFIKLKCTCEPCERNFKIINEYMKNDEKEKLRTFCEN